MGNWFFDKGEDNVIGKKVFSMMLGQEDIHIQKDEVGLFPYAISKN